MTNQADKGLELVLSVTFAFGSCSLNTQHDIQRGIYAKEVTIRLKKQKQNKPIREIGKTFKIAKTAVWNIKERIN